MNYKDTKKLWSKVQTAPVTNTRAVTLGAKFGPEFDDLDAINTHFNTMALITMLKK